MPYETREFNGQTCIFIEGSETPIEGGCHDTAEQADEHMAALYANVEDANKSVPVVDTPNTDATKAGRVLSGVNIDAISEALRRLLLVLQRAGIAIDDVQPDETPQEVMTRKFVSDDMLMSIPHADTAIKSLGDGRIGGYLVVWGNPTRKDITGEYFTPETELGLDWYAQRPTLYQHGLDDTLQATKIGEIDTLRPDDVGVWAEAQLDLRNRYVQAVNRMVEKGILAWSSGSAPNLAVVDPGGRIKRWIIIEGTATPTPAEPRQTGIMPVKAYYAAMKAIPLPDEHEAEEEAVEPGLRSVHEVVPITPKTENQPFPRKAIHMDIQGLIAAMQEQGIESDKILAVVAAYNGGEAPAAEVPAEAPPMEGMSVSPDDMAKSIKTAVESAVREAIKSNGGEIHSQVNPLTAPSTPQISGMNDMLYDYQPIDNLVAAAHLMENAHTSIGGAPAPSLKLYRALHNRMEREVTYDNNKYGRATAAPAMKAALAEWGGLLKSATKANELFSAVTNTQFVATTWDTRLIETVREQVMYQELLSRGMLEYTIPQGSSTLMVPVEGNDPTAYSLVEQNDETSDERMPVTAKSSTITAANQTVTAGMVGIRLMYTYISEEDMVVNAGRYVDLKVNRYFPQVIEKLILEGDTATANVTNINFIDGQPSVDAKGRGPDYLATNGVLKLPLVTTTTLSRSAAGLLSETDFVSTLALLPAAQQVDYPRLMFVLDPATSLATLNIPAFKSRDVFTNATIENGVLKNVYGIDVFRSGFIGNQSALGKTNAAGKIDSTAGNNTWGRILIVRPDRWILGMKRQMTTESMRDIDAQATVVVSTTRFGVFPVSTTGGSAVSYKVAV